MELYDNDKNQKNGKSGSDKLLLGIILLLVIAVISVFGILIYFLNTGDITETKISVYLDGAPDNTLLNSIIVQNEIRYVPIKQLATLVGYEAYNGDYIYISEDINKCHVIVKSEEVIQFENNSNKAYIIKHKQNIAKTELTLNKPIVYINNELCIALEDITSALFIYYSTNGNIIELYSLDALYSMYNSTMVNYGYSQIVDTFTNKKAILNDVFICKNNKNKYGVINSAGEVIIESKYDDIEYVESTGDFIVTYNGQKGIIHNKQTKLAISFDEIDYIDYANLYAVTSNKKIGFFDTNGQKIIDFWYDQVGSKTSVKNATSVEYITSKGLLVVKANGKYGLVNKQASTVVDFYLDDVYSIIYNGKLSYYAVSGGNVTDIDFLVQ